MILGLGAGESMNLDPFGIDWNKPVSRLVEVVKILRKLWSGEVFDYEKVLSMFGYMYGRDNVLH